ncbi:MAG: primosomal protein N' [Chloroflexi bacterium]|nr:primosomal protein N' [Chloroflexota bacterium]
MPFADVCVNTPLGQRAGADTSADPLGQTFTYRVPDRLAGRLEPGHLVWVTLRNRRVQAVVLSLTDTPPPLERYSDIEALVWAQPLLTPAQLALARWIGGYYLAPLIESLRLMLPAGLSQRGRTVFARTGRPTPLDLTSTQAALLARIAEDAGDWGEVTEGLKGVTQRADLEPLLERGLVTREIAFPTPPPRPKTDRQVRLLADAATVARLLPTLGRATKQAEVLAQISKSANQQISLDELCAAVGCGRGPVEALEKRGWVTIARSASKGSALVSLALEGDAILDAIVELRGAAKHRAVLAALEQTGGSAWIGKVYAETDATLDTLRDLEAAGLVTVAEEMVWRDPLAGREFALDQAPTLTEDQERVWESIRQRIEADKRIGESANRQIGKSASGESDAQPADQRPASGFENTQHAARNTQHAIYLLHGVTCSGKTEIYLRAIDAVLRRRRQAVILVPEIALTAQTIRRFAARFPDKVTVWHSELSDGERFDVWRRVRTNHPAAQVVVGARSALFLPYPSLGLIVLDEEHEPSYKQGAPPPRYHARTVAAELSRLCAAIVLLGSATPSLETFYAARRGEIELLGLPKRILGHRADEGRTTNDEKAGQLSLVVGQSADLPEVALVDMRQELRANNRSMFSRALAAELRRVLAARQHAILYLNRRGASTFVMCRDCGHVEACPRCAVPLAYHTAGEMLLCHHCNRRYPVPTVCPDCKSKRIRFFGAGTQNLEEAVKLEFPEARTLRWDRDVTGAKGSHDAILSRFVAHEADVLIGTQMIAKGLDLPLVTLVGVIAADVGLFLPDFRAGERTFQLLTQVAGRAGRSALGGRVIVQTYHPDHYAVVAASHHDYDGFYRQEIAFRRQQGYPPFRRLAQLVYYNSQRVKAEAEATRLADQLRGEITHLALPDTDLIGPAPCFFGQQRGLYRWQVIVRSPDPAALLRRVPLPLGWRLDIDPVDLL